MVCARMRNWDWQWQISLVIHGFKDGLRAQKRSNKRWWSEEQHCDSRERNGWWARHRCSIEPESMVQGDRSSWDNRVVNLLMIWLLQQQQTFWKNLKSMRRIWSRNSLLSNLDAHARFTRLAPLMRLSKLLKLFWGRDSGSSNNQRSLHGSWNTQQSSQ